MKNIYYKNYLNFKNKSILITGGTGSFGAAMAHEILKKYSPRKLIIFSRDEFKQYVMENKFLDLKFKNFRFFIGDVRDRERLKLAFQDVDIVIHAAAMKHVTSSEYNPFECINTNVIGAQNIVSAAIDSKVSKVLALSTDKAANPINLYGASKLAADKIFVSANQLSGLNGCKFSVVRYGNVIKSRGSVINLFQELIKNKKKELPITDKKMTRFWISIKQGVEFVLSNIEYMSGGEIFIPKICSMKVTDIAKSLDSKINFKFIGIRPGEKIHEVLITQDESINTLELNDRYIIKPSFLNKVQFLKIFNKKFKKNKAKFVEENFFYSSDSNKSWLDKKSFLKLLDE